MAEQQVIPARHGTATFVPAGQTIKIINTSGTQVVDTWAFALPQPPEREQPAEDKAQEKKEDAKQSTPQKKAPAKKSADLPSQEDAEKATQEGLKSGEQETQNASQQKSTWSSYVPSIGWSSEKKDQGAKGEGGETQQQKNSKTWASYFPSGKGYSNYIPKSATDTVSSFAATHQRDPNKSYLEQLQDFSRTPVGAAGLSALSGSGYGSAAYAGYTAWNAKNAANAPQMEFMSMPHSRASTLHLCPRVKDTLVSNLREPILTVVEDTSGGVHDTLMAACDPQRYKQLEVENWEEHGSCAENLVLALKELNERAGLKGAKAVGADVTINNVPAPLNLFMNIPWDDNGSISFDAPKSKKDGFVRLKAERDVVVVMSACPQDVLDINAKAPQDAHFLVEDNETPKEAVKRTQLRKRPPPRKISSSHATSTVGSQSVAGAPAAKKPVPQKRTVPAKKTTGATPTSSAQQNGTPKPAAASKPATGGASSTTPVKKKPAPRPVQPQKKPAPAAASSAPAAEDATGSSTAAPVEKKKPRKLTPRPKPAAAGNANGE